ncbi:helix-turn-helix domain-containing protein [Avibacterium paragallinarum]|uniref:helix-turn-helix domain-containing protein n=1 Tax=Avibacterium paragallinarum TaxID=728 RepID=UPI00397E6038
MAKKPTSLSTNISLPLPIESTDSYTITGAENVAFVQVKKANGIIKTATLKISTTGALEQRIYTHYDPELQSIEERNKTIRNLKRSGMTQAEIAKIIGISQPTVSNILNKE